MGFLNKKPIIKSEGFHPIELNEDNVQAIFNRCLATDNTTEHIKSELYHKEWDYLKDSDLTEELTEELNEKLWYTGSDHLIIFDKKALLNNLKNIRYLYGQLIAVHQDTNSIHTDEDSSSSVMKNYQGKIWTIKKVLFCNFSIWALVPTPFIGLPEEETLASSIKSRPPSPRKTPTSRRGGRPTRASGRTDSIVRVCTIELGGLP